MFEHYIPLIDANNGEPTPDILDKIIKEHAPIKQRMELRYEQYKASEQGVQIFSRTFENKDKVNNKLNNDFFSEIIDTKVGYMFGLPIAYSLEEENTDAQDRIRRFLKVNHAEDADAETGKYASICGYGSRLLYHDREGVERMMNIKPFETIFLSNGSITEPSYSIRYYSFKVVANGEFKDMLRVEFYNEQSVIEYVGEGADKLQEVNRTPNLFSGVPLFGFPNNDELLGDLDKAISLLEAYDRTLSDVNSEIEQFRLAYMMFKGVMIDDETIKMLKQTGALELPEEGDAFFLTKQLDDAIIEHHLDRLEKNINRFTKHVNFTEAFGGGTVTGPAMRYKLFMLETKCGTSEMKFTKALRQQFKLLFGSWNLRTNGQLDYTDVTFQFTRNIPSNLLDEAQTQLALKGIVSEETRLSLASFIADPKEELQKMADEMEDMIDLDNVESGGEVNGRTEPRGTTEDGAELGKEPAATV